MTIELSKKPAIYCFVGKPASGKSHLIKSMFYDFAKSQTFKFGICFVKTKFNHDYDYFPDKYVHESFDLEKLKKHINSLREWRRKNDRPVPPNFIILDDLLGDIPWYDPWMTNWVASFRHTSTSIFLTAQYIQAKGGISTCLRECCNIAFLWNSKFKNTLKCMFESFGQLFDSYDEFVEYFQRRTKEKYQCVVYFSDRDNLEENYIPFKAPETIPNYRLDYKI